MDSLAFNWCGENCWLVPPVHLVPRLVLHLLYCRSRGVLVVPFWPSSLFWPYLVDGYGAFQNFVVDFWLVPNGADVFSYGSNEQTCFGSSNFSTPVLFFEARRL